MIFHEQTAFFIANILIRLWKYYENDMIILGKYTSLQ